MRFIKKYTLILNLFIAFSFLHNVALAQSFIEGGGIMESTLDKVTLNVMPEHEVVQSGHEAVFVVLMEIEDGWHLNANSPTFDYLIGVELSVDTGDFAMVSDIQYPKPLQYEFDFASDELAVYEGEAPILLKMMTSGDLPPGEYQIKGELQLQACSDSVCLAPATADVEFILQIGEETVISEYADRIDKLKEDGNEHETIRK